jgi:hypothetical protein
MSAIPNPSTAPDALSISDGHETIGYCIARDGSFFAFDVNFVLLGEFRSQREAVRSIPKLAKTEAKQPKQRGQTPQKMRSLAKLSKDQR